MGMFAGLDVGGKRTAVCVVDEVGKIVFRGIVDTHPEMLAAALKRFDGKLAKVGLERKVVKSYISHLKVMKLSATYFMIKKEGKAAQCGFARKRMLSRFWLDASRWLNISQPTLSNYLRDGRIKSHSIVGEGRHAQIDISRAVADLKKNLDPERLLLEHRRVRLSTKTPPGWTRQSSPR